MIDRPSVFRPCVEQHHSERQRWCVMNRAEVDSGHCCTFAVGPDLLDLFFKVEVLDLAGNNITGMGVEYLVRSQWSLARFTISA